MAIERKYPVYEKSSAKHYAVLEQDTRRIDKGLDTHYPMAFDIETKDGLRGCKLFCWSLAYKVPHSSTGRIEVFTGDETNLHLLFDERKKPFISFRNSDSNKRRTRIIWVHNLSFEVRHLMDVLTKMGRKYKMLGRGKTIALLVPGLKVRFVDTVQFLQTSQEQAEKEWNVPDYLRKIDCTDLFETPYEQWSDSDKQRVINHNKNDVLALYHIMDSFRETLWELGKVDVTRCLSAAQLAMKAYRRSMDKSIVNPFVLVNRAMGREKYSYEILYTKDEFVRDAYRGGRTEPFREGYIPNVTVVDVVSLYPSVMRDESYPQGSGTWVHSLDGILRALRDETKEGFFQGYIIPPKEMKYPILPEVRDGKMMFTLIPRRDTYTFPELRYALENGYKIDWNEPYKALVFESETGYFTNHIDTFYRMKNKSTGGKRTIAKLLLNSLYGKFGQSFIHEDIEYKIIIKKDNPNWLDKLVPENHTGLVPDVVQETDEVLVMAEYVESESCKHYFNVAIAAYVTAYARLRLHKMFALCEEQDIPVYYCDTDSVFIPTERTKDIPLDKGLGGWDVEHEFEQLCILAPKSYIYKEDGELGMTMKGLDRAMIQSLSEQASTINELEATVRDKIELRARYFTAREALLRTGSFLAAGEKSKHFKFKNDKRKFHPSGGSTPWTSRLWKRYQKLRMIEERDKAPFYFRKLNLYNRVHSAKCPRCGEMTYVDGRLHMLVAGCKHYLTLWDRDTQRPILPEDSSITRDGTLMGRMPEGTLHSNVEVRFHKPIQKDLEPWMRLLPDGWNEFQKENDR